MVAIGIRYYDCRNAGIGIIIWPQLRSASDNNSIVWDGRGVGGYKLYINSDVTVDLQNTGILSGTQFILAEDTMFGEDMWDTSQVFYYDPNSTITACATKWGGADDGSLTYEGIKTEKVEGLHEKRIAFPLSEQFEAYAAAVAHEAIRELLEIAFHNQVNPQFPWKGIVKWLAGTNPNFVIAGISGISGGLIARGYEVIYVTTTAPDGTKTVTFYFRPRHVEDSPGSVPQKIKDDWNGAVAGVKQYNPINEGVFPNTQN